MGLTKTITKAKNDHKSSPLSISCSGELKRLDEVTNQYNVLLS